MKNKAQEGISCSAQFCFPARRLLVLSALLCFWVGIAQANPYTAKPGETPIRLRMFTPVILLLRIIVNSMGDGAPTPRAGARRVRS